MPTMKRSAEIQRGWKGPALLGQGFRPFFLLAAIFAALAIAIWPAFFRGEIEVSTAFAPVDWHVHEMIFGYGAAVVAGFLLTAVPNWTGRLPVAGWPLGLLAALWIAGRAAVFASGIIGATAAATIDMLVLVTFAAVLAREVLAGRNWRNAKVVALVALLALANGGFHLEAATAGGASVAIRAGISIIIFLILLIGGRIVPSFTRNWLAKKNAATLPVPFGKPDAVIMMISSAALLLWIFQPHPVWTGTALIAAGILNLWRLKRWSGWTARSDGLVLVLHVGFFLTAIGFLFTGAASLWPDQLPPGAALHVWAVGGIGTMTLAVMTRATLGHSGRKLVASRATLLIYSAVVAATALRVAAVFVPHLAMPLIDAAATAWIVAFAGFALIYGLMLVRGSDRS